MHRSIEDFESLNLPRKKEEKLGNHFFPTYKTYKFLLSNKAKMFC